jgi:hypothetical protein
LITFRLYLEDLRLEAFPFWEGMLQNGQKYGYRMLVRLPII